MKAKLPLRVRTFTCQACGLVIDRDRNAALNLASLVKHVAGSGPETINGRGADVRPGVARPVAVNRQPRTGQTGQDGDFRPERGESLRITDVQ